jgi:two-component system, NarL family, sensor kinase
MMVEWMRPRKTPSGPKAQLSVAGAVTRFVLAGFLALTALTIGGTFALRRIGEREAIRDARVIASLTGKTIEGALNKDLLRGDPRAIDTFEQRIFDQVLGDQTFERVKIWLPQGRVQKIVYSDARALIGERYAIGADELESLESDSVTAEVSDLNKPENRLERGMGKVLEVYLPLRTPDTGEQVLFEVYQRYDTITGSASKTWRDFLPWILGSLGLLWLTQVPLAWSMARRLESGQRERERLLTKAVDASNDERRRIASDLHDGAVQDLAGLSFMLEAAASNRSETERAASLTDGASRTRGIMRKLRSLLVEIHPPNLHSAGLKPALSDLVASLAAKGVRTIVAVPEDLEIGAEAEQLVFRGAREAIQNAERYAHACEVAVEVSRTGNVIRLVVRDDGRGFAAEDRAARQEEGHMGLTLLSELVTYQGGTVEIESTPGQGTRVTLEVPTP